MNKYLSLIVIGILVFNQITIYSATDTQKGNTQKGILYPMNIVNEIEKVHNPYNQNIIIINPQINSAQSSESKVDLKINYDSNHWKRIPLQSTTGEDLSSGTYIYSIAYISNTEAWLGSNLGLWKIDDGKVISHLTIANLLKENSIKKVLTQHDSKLWVEYSDENRITVIDKSGFKTNYLFPGQVIDISISSQDVVWCAFSGTEISKPGLAKYQNGNWSSVLLTNELSEGQIFSIASEGGQNLWIISSKGIFEYDGNSWMRFPFTLLDFQGEAGLNIHYIVLSDDGDLWGRVSTTIFQYNKKTWKSFPNLVCFDNSNGEFVIGKDGSVWSGRGFEKNGITYEFVGLPFTTISEIKIADDGSVWYGTDQGLFIYDNSQDL
jgi:ligand-binding sensor domain-containing protein